MSVDDEKQPGKYVDVAKFAAGSAVVLLVSFGLCGLSFTQWPNKVIGGLIQGLEIIAMVGMIAGVLGLLGSVLAAVMMFFRKD